jgi:uncharacterized membrane protein
LVATLAVGLVAGPFYAFACSVMIGLARTDDRTFVGAMQQIKAAILNGWFAVSFAGAPVLTALAAVLHFRAGGGPALPWILAALVLVAAVLGITFTATECVPGPKATAQHGEVAAPQFRLADVLGDRAEHELKDLEVRRKHCRAAALLVLRPRDELIEQRHDLLAHLCVALGTSAHAEHHLAQPPVRACNIRLLVVVVTKGAGRT